MEEERRPSPFCCWRLICSSKLRKGLHMFLEKKTRDKRCYPCVTQILPRKHMTKWKRLFIRGVPAWKGQSSTSVRQWAVEKGSEGLNTQLAETITVNIPKKLLDRAGQCRKERRVTATEISPTWLTVPPLLSHTEQAVSKNRTTSSADTAHTLTVHIKPWTVTHHTFLFI